MIEKNIFLKKIYKLEIKLYCWKNIYIEKIIFEKNI